MLFIAVSISESDHKKALVKPTFDAKIVHGSGRCKPGSVQRVAVPNRVPDGKLPLLQNHSKQSKGNQDEFMDHARCRSVVLADGLCAAGESTHSEIFAGRASG